LYKKTGNPDHLANAKSFSNTLKKAIKKEARRVFQCKARSSNPKHFWSAMNERMGKFKDTEIELHINDSKITDTDQIANLFANFFLEKVEKLSTEPVTIPSLIKPLNPLSFTLEEVEMSLKTLTNKKSFGPDGIPQNLFKDTLNVISRTITNCCDPCATT
jgi:hypothetical protein